MKKHLLILLALISSAHSSTAQLADGSIAPSMTVTDIEGNTYDLQTLYTSGTTVILMFGATWSAPDWQYLESGALQVAYDMYGPEGTGELMVLYLESDPSTGLDELEGTSSNTEGDYTTMLNFPIVDVEDPQTVVDWQISYYPTIYMVCAQGYVYEIGQPSLEDIELELDPDLGTCSIISFNNNPGLNGIVNTDLTCGAVNLELTLRNFGLDNLTTCDIQITSDQGTDYTINWTGLLLQGQVESIPLGEFDYTQIATVSAQIISPNDNQGDDHASIIVYPTSGATSHIQLDILTDNYPEEISWSITDANDNIIIASEPYTQTATQLVEDFFLTNLGCYQFHLFDSWGDGLAWEGDITGHFNVNAIDADGNIMPLFVYDGSYQYADVHSSFEVVEIVPISITGIVYHDANENAYNEDLEEGIGGIEVHLDNLITYTNPDGTFIFNDIEGSYNTLSIVYDEATWPTHTTDISYDLGFVTDYSYTFGLSANDPNFNLNYQYSEPWFFCGFDGNLYLQVTNSGNQPTDGLLTITLDPLLTYTGASPEPTTVSANVLTWNIENLGLGQSLYINIYILSPTFEEMGETITNTVQLVSYDQAGDISDDDNGSYPTILACSYDPNDKAGTPTGATEQHYIMNGTDLEYLIRFQNTGNYQAFNIHVLDQLDPNLNYSTFQLIATSHYCQPTFDEVTGEVDFYFPDINLPDSTTNQEGSHGFIRYRIAPLANLPELTTIENTAHIYFDFNPAVVTNTTLHTINDTYFGIALSTTMPFEAYPMPASQVLHITLKENLGTVHVRAMDALGNIAADFGKYSTSSFQLNIAALAPGIYTLQLSGSDQQQPATCKLIVAR